MTTEHFGISISTDSSLHIWMSGSGVGRLSVNSAFSVFWVLSTFFDFGFTVLSGEIPGKGVPRFSSKVFILVTTKHIKAHFSTNSLITCIKNAIVTKPFKHIIQPQNSVSRFNFWLLPTYLLSVVISRKLVKTKMKMPPKLKLKWYLSF